MTELENNVVLSLVDSPSLVQTHKVDPEWFNTPKLSILVKFIVDQHGDFTNFVDLRHKFMVFNPTLLTDQDWSILANSQSLKAEFDGYLHELHQSHIRSQITRLASTVAIAPDKKTLIDMKSKIEELEDPEDKPEVTMKQLGDQLDYRLKTPTQDGLLTYKPVDDLLNHGIHGGQLIAIGARPSVGKTAFGLNLVRKTFERNSDVKVDWFSLEMGANEVYQRLVAALSEVDSKKFYNPALSMNEVEKAKAHQATMVVDNYDLGIYDQYMTIEDISRKIRQRAAESQSGHYIAFIDYLQLVTAGTGTKSTDHRYEIEAVSRQLKQLTTQLSIPIIEFSQLSRGIENRENKIPVLSDLRETGAIEQDANVVGFLYPLGDPAEYRKVGEVMFNLQKHREGALGKVKMNFFKTYQKMEATL